MSTCVDMHMEKRLAPKSRRYNTVTVGSIVTTAKDESMRIRRNHEEKRRREKGDHRDGPYDEEGNTD